MSSQLIHPSEKNRQFGSSQIEGRTCSKRLAAYQSTIFQYPNWIGNYSYIYTCEDRQTTCYI